LKCWVSKDGIVRRSVILKSDNRIFNQSALEASLLWRFEPAKMSDGTAADVWVSIPFRFRLN
jgi:TonB family protein